MSTKIGDQKSDSDNDSYEEISGHSLNPAERHHQGDGKEQERYDREFADIADNNQDLDQSADAAANSDAAGSGKSASKEELSNQEASAADAGAPESDNARWRRIAEEGTPEEREEAIDEVKKKR